MREKVRSWCSGRMRVPVVYTGQGGGSIPHILRCPLTAMMRTELTSARRGAPKTSIEATGSDRARQVNCNHSIRRG